MGRITAKLKHIARGARRRLAVTEVLVLGDSHARIFEYWYFMLSLPLQYFNVRAVDGATASGLENPNSKTQAYATFRAALDQERYSKIILILGEVDTGFVTWFRAKKYKASIEDMYAQAVERYCSFLDEIRRYGEVIVISCPLPTIQDNNDWGEVANLRKEVDASRYQRTKLALNFNRAIATHCSGADIRFVGLDEESLGVDGFV